MRVVDNDRVMTGLNSGLLCVVKVVERQSNYRHLKRGSKHVGECKMYEQVKLRFFLFFRLTINKTDDNVMLRTKKKKKLESNNGTFLLYPIQRILDQ
jgi:hypothetical protein